MALGDKQQSTGNTHTPVVSIQSLSTISLTNLMMMPILAKIKITIIHNFEDNSYEGEDKQLGFRDGDDILEDAAYIQGTQYDLLNG